MVSNGMMVKRYFSATARECLRRVQEELGQDAIVVASKAVRGGVEITAMPAASLGEAAHDAEGRLVAAGGSRYAAGFVSPASDDGTVSHSLRPRRIEKYAVPVARQSAVSPRSLRHEPTIGKIALPPAQPAALAHDGPGRAGAQEMWREMQDIRNLLERQLAGFAWSELSRTAPVRAHLMAELLELGFSAVLARRMTQDLQPEMGVEEGRQHVSAILDRRLRLCDADGDLIHRGGVYALVGPTGVGKTTTTAKLAARCVVRYGADRVALLTTDGFRIGAHEQLRIYGRILGVDVHAVSDSDELRRTLIALKDKHMVLIDTAGTSQRDRLVIEQAEMLDSGNAVKRLLLLNATSRGETLDDVIRAYGGDDIAACILSKIDETTLLGPSLDAVARHAIPVAYIANGQRVPEDLHLPNRKYILHRVFKPAQGNMAYRLKLEEAGMVLALDKSYSVGG